MTKYLIPLAIGEPSETTKWVMIGLGAFALVYLLVLRPMMRAKKDPLAGPRGGAGIASLGSQRAVERDMQNLLVEYEQLIRNMTVGLDTRAAKLELLIKEADDKLAALKAATAAVTGGGGPAPGEAPSQPLRRDVLPPPVAPGPDPRHAEIYRLADQGMPVNDIARKVGKQNGEIELILALRSKGE